MAIDSEPEDEIVDNQYIWVKQMKETEQYHSAFACYLHRTENI